MISELVSASFLTVPISSAIFCLWLLFLTPLKRILFSSSSSSSLASWSSPIRRFLGVSVSTRGASPPSSLASCLRFLAAWMNAASGISPKVTQKQLLIEVLGFHVWRYNAGCNVMKAPPRRFSKTNSGMYNTDSKIIRRIQFKNIIETKLECVV